MSRNYSKEQIAKMCHCRFYTSPGSEFDCPVHGKVKNPGRANNPIIGGMKVGNTPDGCFCIEKKIGNGWKQHGTETFDNMRDARQEIVLESKEHKTNFNRRKGV